MGTDYQPEILSAIQEVNTNVSAVLAAQGEYYAVSIFADACLFAVVFVLLIMTGLKAGR